MQNQEPKPKKLIKVTAIFELDPNVNPERNDYTKGNVWAADLMDLVDVKLRGRYTPGIEYLLIRDITQDDEVGEV